MPAVRTPSCAAASRRYAAAGISSDNQEARGVQLGDHDQHYRTIAGVTVQSVAQLASTACGVEAPAQRAGTPVALRQRQWPDRDQGLGCKQYSDDGAVIDGCPCCVLQALLGHQTGMSGGEVLKHRGEAHDI